MQYLYSFGPLTTPTDTIVVYMFKPAIPFLMHYTKLSFTLLIGLSSQYTIYYQQQQYGKYCTTATTPHPTPTHYTTHQPLFLYTLVSSLSEESEEEMELGGASLRRTSV
eukprot:Colp12_sorted_trinity150504_noHs@21432